MSRIDELIEELCPEGVEYKELGEVAEYRRGSFPQPYGNRDWYDGEGAMPFVQVADVAENMLLVQNTKQKISKLAQSKSVFVPKNTVIVTLQGSIGRVAITQYDSFVDRTLAIFEKYLIDINKKYFAYQLEKKFGIEKEFARGSTLKTITKEEFTKFQIPIPPLPVQQEIVNILDKFTQLEAELEAELEARKKQYDYYRNELLNFEGKDVEWKTLGASCEFFNGKGHEKDISETGRYIVVNSKFISTEGKIRKYTNSQLSPLYQDDVLMVMSDLPNGKALSKCYIVEKDNKYTLNQRICALRAKYKQEIIAKFMYYILNRNAQLIKYDNGVDQTNLRKDDILNIIIPIPPLPEQERIVAILDKFDALVNDISEGLPAEIEARRKQYEYYREKLLTFKKASGQ